MKLANAGPGPSPFNAATCALAALVWVSGCTRDPAQSAATDPLGFLSGERAPGFSSATDVRSFEFPEDHGAHPDFRSEWWYFTGNLEAGGEALGFQITLFRFALSPPTETLANTRWATRQVWLGQLAVSDLATDRYFSAERISRGSDELAGARQDRLDVFIEDWRISASEEFETLSIVANDRDFGLELELSPTGPIVLQGEAGLSRKGPTPGNASYYYSVPRLTVDGTVRLPRATLPVTGSAWFDREWSTSALEDDQSGWDWFALQFDDGTNVMVYRLRTEDGTMHAFSAGVFIDASGVTVPFQAAALDLVPQRTWTSPRTGRTYPVDWSVRMGDLAVTVTARRDAQEHAERFEYWEGAVSVQGTRAGRPVAGVGYLEMTGYE